MPSDAERLESALARLYVDDEARAAFLTDRTGYARGAGLSDAQCAALASMDESALELTARGFAHKAREQQRMTARRAPSARLRAWLRDVLGG